VIDFPNTCVHDSIIQPIVGAHIHSPNGKVYAIGGDRKHAYVIDRSIFDQKIITGTQKCGVDIQLGQKISSIEKKNDDFECKYLKDGKEKKVRGKIIVGADGPNSIVRKSFDFPEPIEYIRCIGADVSNISVDPRFVEIFLNTSIAPGFFAWIIPCNQHGSEARIGLGVSQKYSGLLKDFFNRFLSTPLLKDAEIKSYIGGSIPLGLLKKTAQSNVLIVGDAAAQVKPTSGGGLFPGLCCARHCASSVSQGLKNYGDVKRGLSDYHRKWVGDIGRELERGLRYRRLFLKLSNNDLDKLLKLLENDRFIETVNSVGDIDYPSALVKPLVKSFPSIIRSLPGLLFN
jgi:flavin-dependent dehydrogenase